MVRPETIFFILLSATTVAMALLRADRGDRPAAPICASILLANCALTNLSYYQQIPDVTSSIDAASMVALLFAIARYRRFWMLPLCCLSVVTMLIYGVFEIAADGNPDLEWEMVAAVNLFFFFQCATVITASLSGGQGKEYGNDLVYRGRNGTSGHLGRYERLEE